MMQTEAREPDRITQPQASGCHAIQARSFERSAGIGDYLRSRTLRGQTPIDDWRDAERLFEVAARWREVCIEHDDAVAVIERFAAPGTLFYCDPPYVRSSRSMRWGENASVSEARRRSEEMLDLLGLRQKMHLLPEELSGGEKQRVAIGRALIKKPAFCFADEPTSALGWEHGRQVIELLCEAAHQRGATVLIVAHDSRIVPWMDRVWQLRDGRLSEGEASAEPAPEEVLTGRS